MRSSTFCIGILLTFSQIFDVEGRQNAALIIGGFTDGIGVIDRSELFGCEHAPVSSFGVDSYPIGVYLGNGVYFDGKVDICGGYGCDEHGSCNMQQACHQLKPADKAWSTDGTALIQPRYAHLMDLMPDVNATSGEKFPVTFGYRSMSEIFSEGQWKNYVDLDPYDIPFYSVSCNAYDADENVLYTVYNQQMKKIDWGTGEMTDLGEPLDAPDSVGQCAFAQNDEERGIMTHLGYWFNLNNLQWEAKKQPPYLPDGVFKPNAIWSFRGKPTLFGYPDCEEADGCTTRNNTQVFQYDIDADEWHPIGELTLGTKFHSVVEVPGEFCDAWFAPPTTTPGCPTAPPPATCPTCPTCPTTQAPQACPTCPACPSATECPEPPTCSECSCQCSCSSKRGDD